jgi:nitrate/TMAO reductase-like tetraheme cytochrome c subunit
VNTDPSANSGPRPSLLRNWITLTGLVIALGGLFSFLLLFLVDTMAHFSNPYVGILTYLVAPAFLIFGLLLALAGILRARHKLAGKGALLLPKVVLDFSNPRDRRNLAFFLTGTVLFLFLSAIGSYQTYHFTESTQFCGQACHTVMKPELVTYQQGPHARVGCVECHIGPGATWFVKSKLSGTYQVYATAFDKFPRPIPTPIKNLRPARETCEQCHWPEKFSGNLERTYAYFLGDETNTPFAVRMLMKVGGGHPDHGPVSGIHWHVANKVEYYATDAARQTIPFIRVTDSEGKVTEYRTPRFTNDVAQADLRTMDCMDCHNRPAHRYQTPSDAVNLAMSQGRIDPTLPYIKTNALYALTLTYTNESEALASIAAILTDRYPGEPRIQPAIQAVQSIYQRNFFPEMKANWSVYPDNIGHMEWPGCFRCHDGSHKTADGSRSVKASDCNACHTILAQGHGPELEQLTPSGQPFKHPGDEVDGACNDCHTGGL